MSRLELRDVDAGYGKGRVLAGVSLVADPGEILAVVGRNGMGKTTLMKTVIGMLACRNGRIVFDGRDLTRLAPHQRARAGIGYVPQGRDIFPALTVEENLRIGLRKAQGTASGALEEVYALFPLFRERRRQPGGTLSGGEQQMLAIARGLMGRPRMLLLDEPTEGLHPTTVQRIEDLLQNVNRRTSTTILLTEQNLDIVFKLAARCYIMEKGKLVKEVPPTALRDEQLLRTYLAV